MTHKPPSASGPFEDASAQRPPSTTLAELWQKTESVMRDGSGLFVRLSIQSDEIPISFLPNKNWLASVHRLEAGKWEVGLWTWVLRDYCAYQIRDPDTAIAEKILVSVRDITPDSWWGVPQPAKDHPMSLRPMG